jgi:hypothetical protein
MYIFPSRHTDKCVMPGATRRIVRPTAERVRPTNFATAQAARQFRPEELKRLNDAFASQAANPLATD